MRPASAARDRRGHVTPTLLVGFGVPRPTFTNWIHAGVPARTTTRGVHRTTAATLDRVRRAYARSAPRAVSLTMPLRPDPYDANGLLPFFANLLPEGWLLDVSLARLKIARDDAFGLLLATCRDCMGDVEVVPAEAAP